MRCVTKFLKVTWNWLKFHIKNLQLVSWKFLCEIFINFMKLLKIFRSFIGRLDLCFFHELLTKCRPLESAALGACPLSPPPPLRLIHLYFACYHQAEMLQNSSHTCNRILNQYKHAINSYFHMIRIENFHVWCQVVTFSLRENSMKFHITTFTHSPSNHAWRTIASLPERQLTCLSRLYIKVVVLSRQTVYGNCLQTGKSQRTWVLLHQRQTYFHRLSYSWKPSFDS